MKKKKTSNISLAAGVMGVAGAALAGAGAYYFYGSKKAKQHRATTVAWMKKAEKEVIAQVKKLKKEAVNSAEYKKIVAEVSKKYNQLKNVDAHDVQDFVQTLNASWKDIEKDLIKKTTAASKTIKKITKKV